MSFPKYQRPPEETKLDPISVTACLRDLIAVFVKGVNEDTGDQTKREAKALDDCFQLFFDRSPTNDEIHHITPW